MRNTLRALHRWVGLILGIWIALLGISGSLLVYREPMENWQARALRVVEPTGDRLPVQALREHAEAARPDRRIVRLRIPQDDATAAEFIMIVPGARDLYSARQVSVYVDPWSGRVLGERDHFRGWLWQVQDFHYALFSGTTGLAVNGIAAAALLGLGLSGFYVWWPGSRWRTLKASLRVRWGARPQWLLRDLHVVGGVTSVVLLMFLAATAMYFNFRPTATALLQGLLGTPRPLPAVVLLEDGTAASLDSLLAAAKGALPEARLHELRLPPAGAAAVATVSFTRGGEHAPRGNRVFLHPQSAEVLRIDLHRELPAIERITTSMAPWHFGTFGGHTTRALWFLAGVVPTGLLLSGFLVWRRRRVAGR